jgi:hypothetical protein
MLGAHAVSYRLLVMKVKPHRDPGKGCRGSGHRDVGALPFLVSGFRQSMPESRDQNAISFFTRHMYLAPIILYTVWFLRPLTSTPEPHLSFRELVVFGI